MNTAATWIEVVGIATFFVALGMVARHVSRHPGIVVHRLPQQPLPIAPGPGPSPVHDPVPVSLPPRVLPYQVMSAPERRVPSPWAIDMVHDLMWIDRQLAAHVSSDVIRIAAHHYAPEAREVAREVEAALRIVKGELAS